MDTAVAACGPGAGGSDPTDGARSAGPARAVVTAACSAADSRAKSAS
jgi:hypothetical protein